jgi:hypothetical protein
MPECVAITERIPKDPNHPITREQNNNKSQHNTGGSQFVTKSTNTVKYRKSCVQAALRMKTGVHTNGVESNRYAAKSPIRLMRKFFSIIFKATWMSSVGDVYITMNLMYLIIQRLTIG